MSVNKANDFIIESLSKSKEWSYENEFRLLKVYYPEEPTNKERVYTIPDDFIAEIIIGVSASKKRKMKLFR